LLIETFVDIKVNYQYQFRVQKMRQELQNSEETTLPTRRGHPVYEKNPSIVGALPVRIKQNKPQRMGETVYMVAPATGERIGQGAFSFVQEKAVDSENFVKMYLQGIKKHSELGKAGLTLFELVFHQVSGRGGKDKDKVELSYLLAQKWKPDLKRSTYFRGLNELIEKGFLFCSMAADVYFVNINFMFNGDRINLVQSYVRKETIAQIELPLLPGVGQG
jgi:hypothetical protein